MAWDLYLSDVCDHCAWVEEALVKVQKSHDIDIYDCKTLLGKPGHFRAENRATGERQVVQLLAIPALYEPESNIVSYGAKTITERLGVNRSLFIAS